MHLIRFTFSKVCSDYMWVLSGEGPKYSEFTQMERLLRCTRKERLIAGIV